MRSCEYGQVSGPWKTKLLTIKNINFLKGQQKLAHSDPLLHFADCVSIMFELQKKEAKNNIITQHRSSDTLLCPVKVWSHIIRQIISYISTHPETPVNTFMHSNSQLHHFTRHELLQWLWVAAATVGPKILGFSPSDICHSLPAVEQLWQCTFLESQCSLSYHLDDGLVMLSYAI
jgi:hypothetical protein